jgi:hypothetical protein
VLIFQIHLAATAALFGLIWYVQIIHYPLYRLIGEGEFRAYHFRNTRVTAIVVLPLMLAELCTGAWLWYTAPPGQRLLWTALSGLLLLNWASTLFIQVPIHHFLERGKDATLINRLILSNWIRVGSWTLRTVALITISRQ